MKSKFETLLVRLQNPKVLTALISGVLIILLNTGVITLDKANHITALANAILSVLIGVGVVGDPESHVQVEVPAPAVEEKPQG